MPARRIALWLTIILFGMLTVAALVDVGYLGIVRPHFQSWGAAQVLADLTILGVLACAWMIADAPGRGVKAWPFVLLTLLAGSFGPLAYLVIRERVPRP